MSNSPLTPGIVPARLPVASYARNFADHTPPLDRHEARVAADRCYFCHDAPCITACPTSINKEKPNGFRFAILTMTTAAKQFR